MSCTEVWSFKAKNRQLQVQIVPKQGSNPTFIEMGLRILDRRSPPGPTIERHFSASQLQSGVTENLAPAKSYGLLLVTAPIGAEVVVTMTLDDGDTQVTIVDAQTCTRGQGPITGDWRLTTWR
jgi:hypothetical protein